MLPSSDYIIAVRGYDSEGLREQIRDKNVIPVIPRKKNCKVDNTDIDWCLYKYRHLVENVFARLKPNRAVMVLAKYRSKALYFTPGLS